MPVTIKPAFEARLPGRFLWSGGEAPCVFGRSGLVAARDKREGDGATPAGNWALRQAFYRPDRLVRPETGLPVTALTPDMAWCDDPLAPAYNRPVASPCPASHEKLWREDGLYDLIVPLGYNDDPAIAGYGSAIFLHCAAPGLTPTEGCVAVARQTLLDILKTARPGDVLAITQPP